MHKVLFLRREGVYLPEISAYLGYIRDHIPSIEAHDSFELNRHFVERDFDVIWKFMGFDRNKTSDRCIVHEYGSLSVGRFPQLKNMIKRQLNTKPSFRVFLNEAVHREMGFQDNLPYYLRDMGVSQAFFRKDPNPNPEFDFVYSGSLNRGGIILSMLDHFKSRAKGESLLVVGAVPDHIHQVFGKTPNITFAGQFKYDDVPDVITQARYGLNMMPDIYPFYMQTSTKVLEYCAARIPVISTRYKWIEDFEAQSNGKFFYIDQDLHDLTLSRIETYPFSIPSMESYTWDEIIKRSGIFDFLKN